MAGLDLKALVEQAPKKLRRVKAGEFHRVSCPYCPIGAAEVLVIRSGGQIQIDHMDEPRKCMTCGRYFLLKMQFRVAGKKMPEGQS